MVAARLVGVAWTLVVGVVSLGDLGRREAVVSEFVVGRWSFTKNLVLRRT